MVKMTVNNSRVMLSAFSKLQLNAYVQQFVAF